MDDEQRNGAIPDEISLANAMFINPQRYKSFYIKLVRERLKETKLTESSLFFIVVLDDKKGISLKELSCDVGVDKSLTTRMIRHLMDLGYVKKGKGPGKEYSVTLTEEGLKARKKGKEVVDEVSEFLTSDFSEEEKHHMGSVLAKLVRKMENYNPPQ